MGGRMVTWVSARLCLDRWAACPQCHSLPAAAQYKGHRSSHGPPSRASSPPHRSLAVQSSSAAFCSSVSTHVLFSSSESSLVGPGHGGNWTNTKTWWAPASLHLPCLHPYATSTEKLKTHTRPKTGTLSSHKIISLLLHMYNFDALMNHNINNCYTRYVIYDLWKCPFTDPKGMWPTN